MKVVRLFSAALCALCLACGGAEFEEFSNPQPTVSASPDSQPSLSPPDGSGFVFTLNLFEAPDSTKIREISAAADAVVVGTVRSIQPRWETSEFGSPLIFTYVQVEVEDSIKGEANGVITIRNVGGRVGDRMLTVSHVPEFRHVGERALLFLKQDGARWRVPFDRPGKILVHEADTLAFLDQEIPIETVRGLIEGVDR